MKIKNIIVRTVFVFLIAIGTYILAFHVLNTLISTKPQPQGNEVYLGKANRIKYVHCVDCGNCIDTIIDVNDTWFRVKGRASISGLSHAYVLKGSYQGEGKLNYLRLVGNDSFEEIMRIVKEEK